MTSTGADTVPSLAEAVPRRSSEWGNLLLVLAPLLS
jgi:hypothetical protein